MRPTNKLQNSALVFSLVKFGLLSRNNAMQNKTIRFPCNFFLSWFHCLEKQIKGFFCLSFNKRSLNKMPLRKLSCFCKCYFLKRMSTSAKEFHESFLSVHLWNKLQYSFFLIIISHCLQGAKHQKHELSCVSSQSHSLFFILAPIFHLNTTYRLS